MTKPPFRPPPGFKTVSTQTWPNLHSDHLQALKTVSTQTRQNLHSDHLQALKTELFTASASVAPHCWRSRGQGEEQKRTREIKRESSWQKTVTQTTGYTRQGNPQGLPPYLPTPGLLQLIELGDVATVEGVQQIHQPLLVRVLQWQQDVVGKLKSVQ